MAAMFSMSVSPLPAPSKVASSVATVAPRNLDAKLALFRPRLTFSDSIGTSTPAAPIPPPVYAASAAEVATVGIGITGILLSVATVGAVGFIAYKLVKAKRR